MKSCSDHTDNPPKSPFEKGDFENKSAKTMRTTTQESNNTLRLTWPAIIGLALFFAGVSESLRNLWRLVRGEDALVSLIFCLVFTAAGVWIIRREKNNETKRADNPNN